MSSLENEMRMAATAASMTDSGQIRKIMLPVSDLPSLIPSPALLWVRSVKYSSLKMGDVICVRDGSNFAVRRFVKTKMTRNNTLMLTAKEGFHKKEAFPRDAILGRVDKVEHEGQTFDPKAKENFLKQFMGKLTEYGTHSPFGIFKAK